MNNFFSLHISVGCYNNAVPAIAAKTFVSAADSCFINLLKCISGHTIKLMLCFTKGYQDFSAASKMRREIKKALIWVSMYLVRSTNWGHYFYVSNWRRDRHFTWSSEPREGLLAACSTKGVPTFLSHFKSLSIGPGRESNPWPPALQSSALPSQLILPRLNRRLLLVYSQ